MDNLIRILKAAIQTKAEIDIVYQGGSHPGAVRTVLPLSLKEGLLKARDSGSGLSKSYKLELISLPEEKGTAEELLSFRSYHSLYDLLLLEQSLILRSELFVLADRQHMRLFRSEADSASAPPLFYISRGKQGGASQDTDHGQSWMCNGVPYGELQQAAEAFVVALRQYVKNLGE